ncbi:MAG: AzlC family ABC transporter permease [Rhodobacteraceae bacterium]|nr:AzlC family ABC transporter permease [Paracoccaceae bacterium]
MPSEIEQRDHRETEQVEPQRVWFFRGLRAMVSIPALILTAAFVGYAGMARASGLSLGETLLMSGLVWALPSVVVLTGAITSGLGMIPAAIAVTLASVRLMPMTMALIPVVKDGKKSNKLLLLFASHFVAVTAWVYAMRNLPEMPRHGRLAFFVGFGFGLSSVVTMITGIAYVMVEKMPPLLSASLFILTPIYFLCSLWSAARFNADKTSMVAGLVLGPIFHIYEPELGLLWTGILGGSLAYVATRLAERRFR